MPTYEYTCTNCGHTFDVVQAMTDDPLTECPTCGGRLRKVFAPPAIAFKGSGFYATDHGKRSEKKPESGDGSTTTPTKTEAGGTSGGKQAPSSGGESGSSGSSGSEKGSPAKRSTEKGSS